MPFLYVLVILPSFTMAYWRNGTASTHHSIGIPAETQSTQWTIAMGHTCSFEFNRYAPTAPLTAESLETHDMIASSCQNPNVTASQTILHKERSRLQYSQGKTLTSSDTTIPPLTSLPSARSYRDFSSTNLIQPTILLGQQVCKENIVMRSAFIEFILSSCWTEKIASDVFEDIGTRRTDSHGITFNEYSVRSRGSSANDSKEMESVAQTMMRCTQLKIRDSMTSASKKREYVETCFNREEMKYFLVASLWPHFLESDAYKHVIEGGSDECVYPVKDYIYDRQYVRRDYEKIQHLTLIYLQTAKSASKSEWDEILQLGGWVDNILSCLESVPLSISICKVDKVTNSFPFIFVNRSFENTTLYSKLDVLGRNGDCLQCDQTEEEQRSKLKQAFENAEGVKLAITNARKDGTQFLNFLALRPIVLRGSGEYSFILGVQYDVSKPDASLKEMKMVGDVLSILGNILKG